MPDRASANCDLRIYPGGANGDVGHIKELYTVIDAEKKHHPPAEIGKRNIHFCDNMHRLFGATCGCGLRNIYHRRPTARDPLSFEKYIDGRDTDEEECEE